MTSQTRRHSPHTLPPVIPLNIGWHILLVLGCFYVVYQFFNAERFTEDNFFNLGPNVQYFAAFVALIPAFFALLASFDLLQRNPRGRHISLAINYAGAVLTAAYLLHIWDVFIGIDAFSKAIRENSGWILAILFGYGIFWLGGRFDEDSQERMWLERIGMGMAGFSLMLLLLSSDAIGAITHIMSKYSNPSTAIVTAIVLIFAFFAHQILSLGEYFGETTGEREAWQGWMMLSPNIIGFMFFFAGPLLFSFYLSFTDAEVGRVPDVIGLENYGNILALQVKSLENPDQNAEDVLDFGYNNLWTTKWGDTTYVIGAKDRLFWLSMRNTFVFCLMLVPLSTIPALLLAMVLNSKIPGMNFFRAIYFLPSVAAVVGTALIWRWLYDPTVGYFNYTITQIAEALGATDPEIAWLTDSGTILFSIVLLAAWQVIGFNTVLFLAGLQGIPRLLYEAAYVDGANRVQQFFYVTLPMLAPTTFFVIITTIITGLQVFNEPYALVPSRPLPESATTAVYYLYNRGFQGFQFGYASSVAWILFAVIFSVTLIQFRFSRSSAYED